MAKSKDNHRRRFTVSRRALSPFVPIDPLNSPDPLPPVTTSLASCLGCGDAHVRVNFNDTAEEVIWATVDDGHGAVSMALCEMCRTMAFVAIDEGFAVGPEQLRRAIAETRSADGSIDDLSARFLAFFKRARAAIGTD